MQHLAATREPANTFRLWRAADFLMDGQCGTDSFHYFQMWLVGLGRHVYDAAIADPDSLATVAAVQRLATLHDRADDDYPEWESLEYVALDVAEQRPDITGDVRDVVTAERGIRLRSDPDPADVEWHRPDDATIAGAYPRLAALFTPLPHS